jgi:uncharacterized membrane protein
MDIRPNLMPPDGFRGGGAPFRGALVEHSGGGGPSTLAWVIFALVLVLLLLAIASLAIDAYYRSRASRPAAPGPAPGPGAIEALAALDARYARGEIPRDEYLQARDDLRGIPEAPTQVIPPNPEPEAA